jgi:hypothetical protein
MGDVAILQPRSSPFAIDGAAWHALAVVDKGSERQRASQRCRHTIRFPRLVKTYVSYSKPNLPKRKEIKLNLSLKTHFVQNATHL